MSKNGEPKKEPVTLVQVQLMTGGDVSVKFATNVNIALVSHALRLANLEMDNRIIMMQTQKPEPLVKPVHAMPKGVEKRMK